MRHPLDRPIASDLSFESFQRRRRLAELGAPELDSTNQRLVSLPGVIDRHAFLADRVVAVDETEWAARQIDRRQRQLS